MDDTKYLIRANVAAAGVVERNDVVGAIYGQTEGLLGDELDLRDLQRSARVGRIDVEIESSEGASTGVVEIETRLDKVETALLGAALESIEQIGPCEASIEVETIEDVRAARRREVVERAKELLDTAFEDGLDDGALVEEVREHVRVGQITEYEGLPAGPRVESGDTVILVEGRADVQTLLGYGVKNAIAVEGTDVPEAIADLTRERTTTAFLDGDRGGDLILRELDQVADVDYVAFGPEGRSVEDLDRHEVYEALREKVPLDVALERIEEGTDSAAGGEATAGDGRSTRETAASTDDGLPTPESDTDSEDGDETGAESAAGEETETKPTDGGASVKPASAEAAEAATDESRSGEPRTLGEHVADVIDGGAGVARFLDADGTHLEDVPVEDLVASIEDAERVPATVIVDGECTQRVLDVAAQRGVGQVVARERGSFVKQPTDVRVRTAAELEA